jgi:flagellar assembly protein FliH
MSARAKFLFDTDFGVATGSRNGAPPVPAAEHQAAVTEAESRGYLSGMNAAEAEAQRRIAAAHERIATTLEGLAARLHAVEDRLEAEAVEVAVAVARKLAPELIGQQPLAEISALVTECFRELLTAPHVVIRVNDGLYAQARERLDDIARARGFDGRLVVLGEADVAPGDCRVEWADGGLVRDRAATEAMIAEAVGRYVAVRRGGQTG